MCDIGKLHASTWCQYSNMTLCQCVLVRMLSNKDLSLFLLNSDVVHSLKKLLVKPEIRHLALINLTHINAKSYSSTVQLYFSEENNLTYDRV